MNDFIAGFAFGWVVLIILANLADYRDKRRNKKLLAQLHESQGRMFK